MTKAHRAYSFMEVKDFDENNEDRIIRGIATTPTPDRVGDVVDPLGVEFKNPLPFLWQHDHDKPIGLVSFEKPTKKGIIFEARLPKSLPDGKLKERVEEAWQSIKAGLVRAVSIGFRTLEYELIKETGGIKFNKSEILELSAVTIPANAQATINSIKKFDVGVENSKILDPAEVNEKTVEVHNLKAEQTAITPGVSGKAVKLIKTTGSNANKENIEMKKTFVEQLADFEATLAIKNARIAEIMNQSAENGSTLDAAQEEEYETLENEIKSLEKHISRLSNLAATSKETATAVDKTNTVKAGTETRAPAQVKAVKKTEPGIEFAQFTLALAAAKGDPMRAVEIAKRKIGENNDVVTSLKAAVSAGTTTDPDWASALVETYQRFAGDFVEFLRPQTILGKFGQNGVPNLRRVPFNISIPTQTSAGQGYWVGEGAAKPLTSWTYDRINLGHAKVANIAVITDELARWSSPAAEGLVRDELARSLVQRLDTDFVDPGKAVDPGISPASITNGVVGIPSSGTDADAVRIDIKSLMAQYLAANITPTTGVWIMPALVALSLSLMTNALGQDEFPGITMNGGRLFGMPIIVSDYVPAGTVILANASDIFLADDGAVNVDASREVSLQMDNAPTQNSPTPTASNVVSMWQTNSIAVRAERYINWAKRRSQAVAVLTGVAWGGAITT